MLPTKFQVNWLSVQKKKLKKDFKDGGNGGHFGFRNGAILAIFYLQVTPMLPTNFQVNWPMVQKKKLKTDFKDGHRSG